MKKTLKKILVVLLIILTINNFLAGSVYADDDDSLGSTVSDIVQSMLESVVGLLTYPIRFIALAAATAINSLTASIAYIEGSTDPNSDLGADNAVDIPHVPFDADKKVFNKSITPFDIFFNKVKILDVNFLDIETEEPAASSIVNKIRIGIATWYYVLRMIAFAILLVILIYVGIRMSITTIASDKAMYKKMLLDWITSLVLVFLIPYIISFTLIVSNSIINSMSLGVDSEKITNTYTVIAELAFKILDIDSIAATIVYCMLVWQTLGLVFSYFNRMLKVAFLVIISPLITLTYSIDKMGDGKAQALGNWTKEYVYTILIQPFHCIIYMCFIDVAFNLLLKDPAADKNTMAIAIISILCVRFVKEAEKIVRKIFDFKDDGSTSLGAGLAMATMAVSSAKNIGRTARNAVNSTKNFGKGTASALKSAKVNVIAAGSMIKHRKDGDNKSFAERKEDVRTNMNNKQAEKIEKKYGATSDLAVAKRAEQIQKDTPGITKQEAKSMARLEAAKKTRSKNGAIRKRVNKARGAVNKVKSVYNESEFLQSVGSLTRGVTSAGIGVVAASGIYGTGGKLSTALATGVAASGATGAFLKNTTKTLANGVGDNLQALGVKTKGDAQRKMSNIISKFSDKDAADRELKSIVDEIGNALKGLGIEEKHKTSIKNTIQNGIKADPSKTQDIINHALSTPHIAGGNIPSDGRGDPLRNAVQKLANYTNESQIYQATQNAGNVGITKDTFVEQVVNNYEDQDIELSNEERSKIIDENSTEILESSMKEIVDADELLARNEEIDEAVSFMYMDELKELESMFEEKIKELESSNAENAEELIRQLEMQKLDIISKAIANINTLEQGSLEEMNNKYGPEVARLGNAPVATKRDKLNNAKADLERAQRARVEARNTGNYQEEIIARQDISRLRGEVDKYQKEVNNSKISDRQEREILEARKTRLADTAKSLKERFGK